MKNLLRDVILRVWECTIQNFLHDVLLRVWVCTMKNLLHDSACRCECGYALRIHDMRKGDSWSLHWSRTKSAILLSYMMYSTTSHPLKPCYPPLLHDVLHSMIHYECGYVPLRIYYIMHHSECVYVLFRIYHMIFRWCVSVSMYYGVTAISRLLQSIGFFCRISSRITAWYQ